MKCPAIIKEKKKGSGATCGADLLTKRTFANGTKVRRERACPKCGVKIWTVEQFENDVYAAEFEQGEQIRIHDQETRNLLNQIGEYEIVLLGFQRLMEKAAETVKKS